MNSRKASGWDRINAELLKRGCYRQNEILHEILLYERTEKATCDCRGVLPIPVELVRLRRAISCDSRE